MKAVQKKTKLILDQQDLDMKSWEKTYTGPGTRPECSPSEHGSISHLVRVLHFVP